MTIRYINTGSSANAGDGDSLRSAFNKVNSNFAYVESIAATGYTGSAGSDGNIGYTGSAGSGITRWDAVPAEAGCPIYTELTTDYFYAYTQKSHLRLENAGNWDVGSDWNNNGVGSFDGSTLTLNALTGNIVLNSGYSNSWTFDSTGTLTLPTGYSIGGNTNGNDGIALTTDRGTVLFGNRPECVPTLASHFHIMRDDPTTVDLFFGDDYNYVKLPYYSTLTNVGVEIGADGPSWQFNKDGTITFPNNTLDVGSSTIYIRSTNLAEFAYNNDNIQELPNEVIDAYSGVDNAGPYMVNVAFNENATDVNYSAWGVDSKGNLVTGIFYEISTSTGVGDIVDIDGNSIIYTIASETPPTRAPAGRLWYNSIEGRMYIRYEDLWVDASPTVVPPPSTYLGGLTVDGTTIGTVDTSATVSVSSGMDNIWTFNNAGTLTFPAGYALPNTVGTAGQVLSVSTNSNVLYWTTASSGVSFRYATIQEGITSHPVTSITGNSGDGLSLTSELWAQLMWVPDTSSVTLNDIDQGAPVYHWAYVDGGGFHIENKNLGSTSTWKFGTDGILEMPPGNEGTQGWIQWSHASDDLTNTAGAGFVDFYNVYTGLGLVAPTDTNAAKSIWFGTPADPLSPFDPETSMVFKGNSLYLPKNGYIKSHDIDYSGYPTLGNTGTSITIQTAATTSTQHNWVFGADGNLTLPGLMTLPVTTSIPVITTATGTVAVCDGTGWDGGSDGLQHLMIYINNVWTKVI